MNTNETTKETAPTPTKAEQIEWAYLTVTQFTAKHKAFTVGGIRSLIFNENSNGLAKSGAVVRVGRKVLLNEPKFFGWVQSQNRAA